MRRIPSLITGIVLVLFAAGARAQGGASPVLGFDPYGSFQSSPIDNVNVSNGNVVVKIPLFSLPQKGAFKPVTYSIVANSMPWTAQMTPETPYGAQYHVVNAAPLGAQIVSDAPMYGMNDSFETFTDTYGNAQWVPQFTIGDYSGAQHSLVYNGSDSTELRTVDGSGYKVKYDGTTGDPFIRSSSYDPGAYIDDPGYPATDGLYVFPTIYGPNGIKTHVASPLSGYWRYDYVSDLDGNEFTYPTESVSYSVDTIGRHLNYMPGGVGSLTTTNVTRAAGGPCPTSGFPSDQQPSGYTTLNLVANSAGTTDTRYSYTLCYTNVSYQTSLWGFWSPTYGSEHMDDDGAGYSWWEASGTYPLIQSVILADGSFWGFVYDNATSSQPVAYGIITKIIKPTGGAVAYCYGSNYSFGVFPGAEYGGREETLNLPLLTKREEETTSDSNSNACSASSGYWGYTIDPWLGGIYTTATDATVTDPLGNQTYYTFDRPGETAESIYSGSATGTPLKSTTTTYSIQTMPTPPVDEPVGTLLPISAFPSGTTTALNGTTVGSTASTYTGSFTGGSWSCTPYSPSPPYYFCSSSTTTPTLTLGQPYSMTTYNGSGGTLSSTSTSYMASSSSSAYWTTNQMFLKASETTSDSTSSKSTTYCYDESSPAGSETSCASPSATLGHLTTTILESGVDTHTVWNTSGSPLGMPSSTKDANGYSTGYSYDSTGLYVSSITHPDGEVDSYTYDDMTGAVLTHTDPNSQTTTYSYDLIGRPWAVQNPDAPSGHRSEVACYPSATSIEVFQAQQADLALPSGSSATSCPTSSTAIVQTKNVDGLGRVSSSLTAAPEGTIETHTAYDALGHVATVSNPYIGTLSGYTTYSSTSYPYDALSRVQRVTNADGSFKGFSYPGLSTITTDENLNETQTTTDFLGRITDVYEPTAPSTTPTLQTHYTYNVNGLVQVDQYGVSGVDSTRTRKFAYDSLARLIASQNPETGNTQTCSGASGSTWGNCYGYDANGNLTSKTDARSATTSYSYDNMNRLQSKSYSASLGALLTCYQYGTTSGFIGRLVNEWTQTGSSCTSPSGTVTSRSMLGYDVMGRITKLQQCTLTVCSFSTPPAVEYSYDLTGKINGYTSGLVGVAGQISFGNTFDTAGRLLTTMSSWNDLTHPGVLFSALSYNANGLTSANLGNHLDLTRTYDSRMRIATETVGVH